VLRHIRTRPSLGPVCRRVSPTLACNCQRSESRHRGRLPYRWRQLPW